MLHHLLLIAAVAALWAAGLRVAAAAGARGPELPIGAAVVAAAAAGVTMLAAQTGSAWVLALLAVAVWGAAAWWLPPVTWPRLPRGLLAGAALGAAGAWLAWLVKHPALAIDPLSYHLPESIMWVQQGTPGSVELLTYEFPQGNYPVTNELLVSWLLAIGRSFAPALVWTPLMGALLAAAAYALLPRWRGPAAAAVLLVPVAATQFLGPHTDLPAVAWLAACAALTPLPLAFLAGALAVGTKTTVAPLVIIVLLTKLRRPLPWRPLVPAVLAGCVVGGAWYFRNWVEHGSPLWPFIGDDIPPFLARFDDSFLDDPAGTLRGREDVYVDLLAGGLLVLAAALFAARRAPVAVAATVVAALAWGNAPFTGLPDDPAFAGLSLTTTRYLLPAIAAGAAALAFTRSRWAGAVLAAAALFSLQRSLALPFPGVPGLGWLLLGALAGAALLPFARRIPVPAAALLAAAALTLAADGFAARHGGVGRLASSGVVSWFAAGVDDDAPVAFAPQMLAVLAGDRLEHPIEMIPAAEPCEQTRTRTGYLVIGTLPLAEKRERFTALDCLRDERPVYADPSFRVYRRR